MAGLDDLLTPQENTISGGGGSFTFVDADTVRTEDGKRWRLQGVNAPETAHFADGQIKSGEVGGQMTTQEVYNLANSMGYTNLVPLEGGAAHGRGLADLHNDKGQSFRQALAREGILTPDAEYDISGLQQSADYGAFMRTKVGRETTAWDEARANIANAVADEQQRANQFRRAQLYAGQAMGISDPKAREEMFNQSVAAFQYGDRATDTGKANNPFSAAWDTGLTSTVESAYGVLEMMGETMGNEWLDTIGEAGKNRAQTRMQDKGHFITSYKDVDDFGSAIEFFGTNFAMSLPYMGATVAGAVASPFTGGASMLLPVSLYTGNTWNEMEGDNKNAAIAIGAGIAQATLDRVGIGYIFKTGVAPKKVLQEGIEELVKKGHTREQARDMVMAASRKEIADFTRDAGTTAANQIKAKRVFTDLAGKMALSAGGEGTTEAMQEGIAYLAAHNTGEGFSWEDLSERLIHAVAAGGALGATFGAPGSVANSLAWADVAVRQQPAEAKRLSEAGKWAQREVEEHGRVATNAENAADARARVATTGVKTTLDERVEANRQAKKDRTWGEFMSSTFLSIPSLWQGATRFIFNDGLKERSRAARKLADMFGGGLQKTFSGASMENEKHHRVAIYKNMVPIPEKIFSHLAGGKRLTGTLRKQISGELYTQLRMAIDPETGKFDPALVQGPNREVIMQLGTDLNKLADRMWQDQKQHNPELGYIDNYLLRYKGFNKRAIDKGRDKFIQALVDDTGMSHAEARDISYAITDNAEVNNLDEAFSVVKGGIVPGSHRKRSLNLSEKENFQEFMEQDLFANVAQAAKSAARYTTHRDFVGMNGEVIAKLLDDMEAEGIPKAEVDKVAAQMKDYLDAESGNYKRPTSDMGKAAMRLQKNFMMLTTMAGLPLAVVSSMVEIALTMKGLRKDQIFGEGGLESIGKEGASALKKGVDEIVSAASRKEVRQSEESAGQQQLRDLGYYEWDVGAATVTGVTETSPASQYIYEGFFKWTGLTGWTNYTRAVRASMAGDYVMDKLTTVINQRMRGDAKTNEVQEAEEGLRNLGINVDQMVDINMKLNVGMPLSPEEETILADNMREASYNFVNEAIALPGSANRPLIYQDPRFALFTQFQGFMATFTANHIPKLWGEYVKRGTPAMKYNAFATMVTMIMLGFLSQSLKDWLKYDEEERKQGYGGNPYLNKAEFIQRGIRSSGLLGTGERVLDQFFPIYETRSDNPGEWIWNTSTGESPALSNVKRAGKGIGKALEGDFAGAGKQAGKLTPFIGPISGRLGGVIDEWNFLGE